ncbi:hypothetical protein BJX65DRAFT_278801 [Aspergillus insuetus]
MVNQKNPNGRIWKACLSCRREKASPSAPSPHRSTVCQHESRLKAIKRERLAQH